VETVANYRCALCKYAALSIKRQKYHIDCEDLPGLNELFNYSYILDNPDCDSDPCTYFPTVGPFRVYDPITEFECNITININNNITSCNPMYISIT
jgi:hypothetical protein